MLQEQREEIREKIKDILHEFYIEVSTSKMSKEQFEKYIDRIIELFAKKE